MEGWTFSPGPDGSGWEWHYAGSPMVESKRSSRAFPTLAECMSDAALHGYNRRGGSRGDPSGRNDSENGLR